MIKMEMKNGPVKTAFCGLVFAFGAAAFCEVETLLSWRALGASILWVIVMVAYCHPKGPYARRR